jgi:two-component system nitrate/nitrite response regulator NarL
MRILIADARPQVRFALRVLLGRQPGLEMEGEVVDARALLAQIQTTCPDTLLLDWELPGMAMDDLVPALRDLCSNLAIIALSSRWEACRTAMAAGVDAFVSKSSPPERLLSAIKECSARERMPS